MFFKDFNLSKELLLGITSNNFSECTPIQSATIPEAIKGKDIAGLAQTGTGKTAAFLLPLIERVFLGKKKNKGFLNWKHGHFCLVLVPTRELAEQVYQDFYSLKGKTNVDAVSVYGGTVYEKQKKMIRSGVEFIISTPGRLIDLYKSHFLDLRQCRAVVFDEADKMFDMGFKEDMLFLLHRIPKNRQLMFFSATMNFGVTNMAYKFNSSPIEIDLSKKHVRTENVDDFIYHVGVINKPQYLLSVLKKINPKQTIIFSNFKHKVERIGSFLNENGYPAVGISSLLTQSQRSRVMKQFKDETKFNILVATDVAARGLDVSNVDLVINYELSDDPENYVHRIGRTGRANQRGSACSLVSDEDIPNLLRIEEYLSCKLKVEWLDDVDLVNDFKKYKEKKDYPKKNNERVKTKPARKKTHKKRKILETEQYKKPDKQRKKKRTTKSKLVRKGRSAEKKKGIIGAVKKLFR